LSKPRKTSHELTTNCDLPGQGVPERVFGFDLAQWPPTLWIDGFDLAQSMQGY
jgi:hypothetical protein